MGRIARLASTIEDLREGLAGGRFQSEAEISQGVVKRILHDLGWDTFDVQVVKPEFKIESRMVDYALCQPPGSPAVLVEVKALGKADVKGQKQLFHYCFDQGVPIAVLTDGCEWHLFYTTGQGAYEDRLFARLNLIDDGFRDSATTLAKYLNREDVRSGAARKVAEEDYETRRQQRQAVTHFRVVWRRLLAGPDSLLLDLFREEVENETGVRPSRVLAAEFIRSSSAVGLASRAPRRRRTIPVGKRTGDGSRVQRGVQEHSFTFEGRTEIVTNGVELLGAVFSALASRDPEFCRLFSQRCHGRKRQYVAKRWEELYPGRPEFRKSVHPLPGGWYVATHSSNAEKIRRIRQACKVAGLEFGKDLAVNMPVGRRRPGRKGR